MTSKRRIAFVVFIGLIIACLLTLGTWQVQRMHWKKNLIAQSQKALTAKPVKINDIAAGIEYGYSVDWLRITLTGSYRHDLERYHYQPGKSGTGYNVLTPFIDKSGFIVFVDRGWIPESAKNPTSRTSARTPKGEITITGVTRLHASGLTMFLPQADAANKVWYWYDRETLAASLPAGVGETADGQLPTISPVFVQLEPGGEPGAGELPKIGPVKLTLPNNHLVYAITWFSLALIMAVMLILYLRANRNKQAAP